MDVATHRQSSSSRVQNLSPTLQAAGASATPERALAFELLESKLRPPQGRFGTVSREGRSPVGKRGARFRSLSWPPARAGGRRRCSLNGPPARNAHSRGWMSMRGQRPDRPPELRRGRARSRRAARPARVRFACVTGSFGRGDCRSASGGGSGDDWPAGRPGLGRPAPCRRSGGSRRRFGARETCSRRLAAGSLSARRAGNPAGSTARARSRNRDRAG